MDMDATMSAAPARECSGRLNRAWRIVGTGISFAAFGIGGFLLRIVAFPLLGLCVLDKARRRRIARRWVQRSFAAQIALMCALGVMTHEVRGRERLDRGGLLILANHPTLIDVVALVALLPNADCVVKAAARRNPFFRGPIDACGYIGNDDGAALVDDCIEAVRAGGNLVIFPEGTRTVPGQPLKLQRGAAYIALRGGFDIVPVRISCVPSTLGKGRKWYRVPARRFHLQVEIGEDLPVAPFLSNDGGGDGNGEAQAARRLTAHLAECLSGRDFWGIETHADA